jgi:acetylornithine deacetylase/succinyl-diaminopimelate desuccinylase-like protein
MQVGDVSADEVAGAIDPEEIAELALELGNIDSPPGEERDVSDRVLAWLDEQGIEGFQLGLVPERPNVIGRLRGDGTGRSVAFNAHLDTAWGPQERRWMKRPHDPVYNRAWRDGDYLYGNPIVNDKGPLAATLVALAALHRAQTPLRGDVVVMGVCGEIGQEPVDEFAAPAYLSKEVGTRYVIEHGVVTDVAVVAEATNFGLAWVEAGKAFYKVTVVGDDTRYTPYVTHPDRAAEHGNAIVRAQPVVAALTDWARDYERRHVYEGEGGRCVPKVNIGAIRGGMPFIPISSPEKCFLYLDVRLTPAQHPMDVQRELTAVLTACGVPTELDCFLYRRGYEASGADLVVEAVGEAHVAEFGEPVGGVHPGQSSAWRDTNPFNELHIPAVTYGPSAGMGGGRAWTAVADLARAARVYARTALAISAERSGSRP